MTSQYLFILSPKIGNDIAAIVVCFVPTDVNYLTNIFVMESITVATILMNAVWKQTAARRMFSIVKITGNVCFIFADSINPYYIKIANEM